MGAGGRGGGAANGGRKAVLRNKSEDMNDPDFRRNRLVGPTCGGLTAAWAGGGTLLRVGETFGGTGLWLLWRQHAAGEVWKRCSVT